MISAAPSQLRLYVASDPVAIKGVRRAMESFGRQCGLSEHAVAEVGLCVNEAVANIIRHAYAGQRDRPIEVNATLQPSGLRIELRDWGSGVYPDQHRDRVHDPLVPGGVGLLCIRSLMDRVEYHRCEPGMLMVMTKHIAPQPATLP